MTGKVKARVTWADPGVMGGNQGRSDVDSGRVRGSDDDVAMGEQGMGGE